LNYRRFRLISFLVLLPTLLLNCGRPDLSTLQSEETTRFWSVAEPGDENLNQNSPLMRYMRAAAARELPLRFFRELIKANAAVTVIEGDWPTYHPGILYGGTISIPSANRPEAWTVAEWSSFYNELFHAWYGLIFLKQATYTTARNQAWSRERILRYKKAHPSNPKLAQEEAWSETVGSVMIQLAPLRIGGKFKYSTIESFAYCIGRNVAPVSHSDRPGYTPEAENTYPDEAEYRQLFFYLAGVRLPEPTAD
jgi:hypothetical protein